MVTIEELIQIVDDSAEYRNSYLVCKGLKNKALVIERKIDPDLFT